ncbi:MAG: P-loop NTPase [Deltaproteobacteria bacterium]|nr:P-loop NTPase [Deltaproteobacteria bacterium]
MLDLPTLEAALDPVLDPVFEKPMRAIGSLLEVKLEGTKASLRIKLPSPSPTIEAKARRRLEEAAKRVGVTEVVLDIQVEVPTREVLGDDPVPGVRNVILVMSGKGGVGKSTTAVNLTLALAKLGHRVGLLDADIYGPSIPTMMGVSGQPISKDGKRISPLERFGVKMMSIGFLLEDEKQAVVWRGPMLHGALKQFLEDVDWGTLDFLVLDLPPGTGDVALTMAQKLKVTGVVMVTTPQEVALQDVYKSVSMCHKLSLPILGVVENMSYFVDPAGGRHDLFGKGGGQKIADFAQAPLLGQIPIVQAVREQGDKGFPIVQAQPDGEVTAVFLSVAEALVEKVLKDHFERTGGEKLPAGKGPTRLKIMR